MAGKSEGRSNHKAQSSITVSRNKRLKAERHTRRIHSQAEKRPWGADGMAPTRDDIKVPRGAARNERRKPLQQAYAKRKAPL